MDPTPKQIKDALHLLDQNERDAYGPNALPFTEPKSNWLQNMSHSEISKLISELIEVHEMCVEDAFMSLYLSRWAASLKS